MNKIAKISNKYYPIKEGEKYLFLTSGKWPNSYVEKLDEDKYLLIKIMPRTKFQKEVLKNKTKFVDFVEREGLGMGYIDAYPMSWYNNRFKKTMDNFGTGLINQLYKQNFDVRDMKYIGTKKIVKKAEVYNYIVVKEKFSPGGFVKLFGDLTEKAEIEGVNSFKFKNWKVFIEDKTKVDPDEVKKFLNKVTKELNSEGFGKLTGHKVHFVYAMSSSHTLADYNLAQKEIRVKVRKNLTKDHVHSMIHELGHKHYYETLSGKQRQEISLKYSNILNKSSSDFLDIGDYIQDKEEKDIFEIVDYKGSFYIGKLIENNSGKYKETGRYKLAMKYVGAGLIVIKSKRKSRVNKGAYFVSSYSTTSPEEFYAELFTEYVLKSLKPEAFEWFSDLLAGHLQMVSRR